MFQECMHAHNSHQNRYFASAFNIPATMHTLILLISFIGSISCDQFMAAFNMGGVMGYVQFDSISQNATVNVSGTGSCGPLNFSITEFPVMYGHFGDPCVAANIGSSLFTFTANPTFTTNVNLSSLFKQRTNLDDLSLSIQTCNNTNVCTVISRGQTVLTNQARFTGEIAGNVYIRRNEGQSDSRLLIDLLTNGQVNASSTTMTLFSSGSSAMSCIVLLGNLEASGLTNMGEINIGTPLQPGKSRLDISNYDTNTAFLILDLNSTFMCAQIYNVPEKHVTALFDMKGIHGYIQFRQASPFDQTEIQLNLTNLQSRVGPYHVHNFPVPSGRTSSSNLCSNDNVGGHWNPFGIDTSAPTYPTGPGATHDMYEVGDLSSKHKSLTSKNIANMTFHDFNLPLFGRNSIVGRSVVIHLTDGARYVCASIGYPGEVIVARARFTSPLVGDMWFTQLKDNPLSDVSTFVDLSYGNPAMVSTRNHNWHIHIYPISSERDDDETRCSTTGGHWNPFGIDTQDDSYALHCGPSIPVACEVGDFASKHRALNFSATIGEVESKSFFTDVTSWLQASGIIGRSVVIHQQNSGGPRIACANITEVRPLTASLGSWFGPGISTGGIQFNQSVPNGPTKITLSLSNLNAMAGGYHVHVLPIKPNSTIPCSAANIGGHYNPLSVNISQSPDPGNGTVDQYEIGDISGKFGLLTGLSESQQTYIDGNLPLTGPHSIVGRSVVVHYINGSRMRCADVLAERTKDGEWTIAKAVFSGSLIGEVRLFQQMYPDGSSSDTTMEVILQSVNHTQASLFISNNFVSSIDSRLCSNNQVVYNPFNMTSRSSSCSLDYPLGCVVGEFSERHGPISLRVEQAYTDNIIQLSGDFTVVNRALVLKDDEDVIACANIVPESPSADQTFRGVTNFSRYEFRTRVANVLQIETARVTILANSPTDEGQCQRVSFMISGNVSDDLLNSVKNSELMGMFRESDECDSRSVGGLLAPANILVSLMFVAGRLCSTI
ncbi:uncharacterized protein cusr [Stigmatopora argus]